LPARSASLSIRYTAIEGLAGSHVDVIDIDLQSASGLEFVQLCAVGFYGSIPAPVAVISGFHLLYQFANAFQMWIVVEEL
jgi:hypothetical protein